MDYATQNSDSQKKSTEQVKLFSAPENPLSKGIEFLNKLEFDKAFSVFKNTKNQTPEAENGLKVANFWCNKLLDNNIKSFSAEELAEFWDTHDLTDFEDQLEEVTEPIFERKEGMVIPLAPQEVAAIRQIAQSQGVDLVDLIRGWVLEKIQAP